MGTSEGGRLHLEVVETVPRVNGRELSYEIFWRKYMKRNIPVLLTGLTPAWRACSEWVGEAGGPDLSQISERFGGSVVQVAECGTQEYSDQKRLNMSVRAFMTYWQNLHMGSEQESFNGLLYLKDWHFVKEYPQYCAYRTPRFFRDDWLNGYYDKQQLRGSKGEDSSDYRFVYMGPKGTWTPLHADVLRSYSWSANICGRKQWHLLPPEQTHLLFDRHHCHTVYDIYSDVSERKFPGFSQTRWMECDQRAGDILFVPSGWYHQVINLEDTISVNHNWINACNIHWAWLLLQDDYRAAVLSIEDIRSVADDFEELCQRNLAANSGMNFVDFFSFLLHKAEHDLHVLVHDRTSWEQPTAEFSGVGSCGNKKLNQQALQSAYNLSETYKVLMSMSLEEVFVKQHKTCQHACSASILRQGSLESKWEYPRQVGRLLQCEACTSFITDTTGHLPCAFCTQLFGCRGPLFLADTIQLFLHLALGTEMDSLGTYGPTDIEEL